LGGQPDPRGLIAQQADRLLDERLVVGGLSGLSVEQHPGIAHGCDEGKIVGGDGHGSRREAFQGRETKALGIGAGVSHDLGGALKANQFRS